MEERKTFTYDGMNSADFDLYIAGDSVYDAPTRDMDMITIPGRNGQLSIDQGRFENITVTYPCFIWADTQEEFRTKARAIRNWLCAKTSYFKLSDEYNPESYRLGIYKSGLEVEPIFYNRAGRFELSFDCKPQRFLLSGDEPITLGEWGETETYSGSIVSFDGTETTAIKSLKVNITPKQSGSGDPSPSNVRPISGWDAVVVNHTGKNLFNHTLTTRTVNGTTFTVNADKSITISGTPTDRVRITISSGIVADGKNAEYFSTGGMPSGTRIYCRKVVNGATSYPTISPDIQFRVGEVFDNLAIEVNTSFNGTAFTIYPMVEVGTSATAYEPYEAETITTNLPQTVYGGVLDVVSGKLTAFPYYSSYNGETLSGEWICDRAVYSQGATPPTGSQVVDMSGTGTELTLTPTEVNTLLGTNNIWSDAGTVEVEIGENPNTLVNPTPFESCPVFEVEGSGTLTVNNSSMTIANNGTTIIDSEMMEAYEEENGAIVSRNDMVSGEFPTLKEGNNNIGAVGLTSVKVKPRWWEV